ncbi:MAG: hypothetical protein JWQ96_568 [Segetibacter sp.]|nr:hypothetical protein [Segetibacter sp.]
MCVCLGNEDMLCGIGAGAIKTALEMKGVRLMTFNDRTSKGYAYVSIESIRAKKKFDY